jgi:hypothetical protein
VIKLLIFICYVLCFTVRLQTVITRLASLQSTDSTLTWPNCQLAHNQNHVTKVKLKPPPC